MFQIENNALVFAFPEVHGHARSSVLFHRTLRIPDDDKQYSLPPSLGCFPLKNVNNFEKAPDDWKKVDGVMFPMWQSEAMWMQFQGEYPMALKIYTGNVSALTGKQSSDLNEGLIKGDYIVITKQPWIDGFVVGEGFIRQFVAAILGSGVSVEAQLTGEDKVGGLCIEAFPMKKEEWEKIKATEKVKFQNISEVYSPLWNSNAVSGAAYYSAVPSITKCSSTKSLSSKTDSYHFEYLESSYGSFFGDAPSAAAADDSDDLCDADLSRGISEMSLAAGGKMTQQIFEDPYGIDVWDQTVSTKVFVRLVNSESWKKITYTKPPTKPLTAKDYSKNGYPWFNYYEDKPAISPNEAMKSIKSVNELAPEMLPENEKVTGENVIDLSKKSTDESLRV